MKPNRNTNKNQIIHYVGMNNCTLVGMVYISNLVFLPPRLDGGGGGRWRPSENQGWGLESGVSKLKSVSTPADCRKMYVASSEIYT